MAEKRPLSPRAESTRNSLEYAGAGAGLIGAGAGADALVAADRKRKGMDGPIKAARKKKFTRRHAGQLGVKLGGRAAVATGLPLAAYGAYTAFKPDQKTPRMDVKRDVVKPAAKGVALRDLADQQAQKTGVPVEAKKSDLTEKETKKLVSRKKRTQAISTTAGLMGLGALALRAPEGAKFAAKRSARAATNSAVKRIAGREPNATKASNALGIGSIGVGAAGSLNFAAQQHLETKAIKKSFYDGIIRGIGRGRVVSRPKKGYVTFVDSRDVKRFVPESRVTPVPKKKAKRVEVDKPAPVQDELPFGKSAAWQRAEGKNPNGGLNAKGRESYARQTGGKLRPPVKQGDNPRRKAFLSRMGNMPGAERDSQGKKTRLALSLQAWGASSKADARRKASQMKSRDEKPSQAPVAKKLTPEQKAQAKARAKRAGRRYPNAYDNMKSGGAQFGKSDKFLREYGDRISPKAEAGYKHLKRGRNEGRAQAAVGAGAAGITGAATAYAARDAKRMGLKTKGGRIGAGLAAAGAGLTAWNTVGAARGAQKAHRWNKPMKRIEAKAKERAAAGEYGRDRLVGKAAAHCKQVGAFQRGITWVGPDE